MHLKKQCLTG